MKKINCFFCLIIISINSFSQSIDVRYPSHSTIVSSSFYEEDTLLLNLSNSLDIYSDSVKFLKQIKITKTGNSLMVGNFISGVDSTVQSFEENGSFIKIDSHYISMGQIISPITKKWNLGFSVGTENTIDSLYVYNGAPFAYSGILPHPYKDSTVLIYGNIYIDSSQISTFSILEFNFINKSFTLLTDTCNKNGSISGLLFDQIHNKYIITGNKPFCPNMDSIYGNSYGFLDTNFNIATPISNYIDLSYTPHWNMPVTFQTYDPAMVWVTDSTIMVVGDIDNPSNFNTSNNRWGYDVAVSIRRASDFSETDTTKTYGILNVAEVQNPALLKKIDSSLFITATNLEFENTGYKAWNTELALLGLDEKGNKHWMNYFPFNDYCWTTDIHPDEKGGIWTVAQCSRLNSNQTAYYYFTKVMYIDSVAHWPRIGQTSSISENKKWNKNFKIFPNPSNEMVSIQQYGSLMSLDALFYDINGRLLKEVKLDEADTEVNVQEFSPGVYFIKITHKGEHIGTEKILVE